MATLTTLSEIQVNRSLALPQKLAENPVRTVALDTIQRRNAVLDAVFYDVAAIRPEETVKLATWLAREGAIIVVPPSGSGTELEVFLTPQKYFESGEAVAALAVAGVGSSALGAAAFARNVADALGKPVAAVVSGYGLADLLTEALGGFFMFGALNSIRHAFEPLDEVTKLFTRSEQTLEDLSGLGFARTSRDTQTVIALLKDARFAPELLVGHSKGNLVISEALYAIHAEDPALEKQLAERLRIVTISAKIGMPHAFRDVLDVMGAWDWFGALNSRPDLRADYTVPHAWHSTNPEFPFGLGLRVPQALRTVLGQNPSPSKAAPLPFVADLPQKLTAALHAGTPLHLV
ncbi:hypothetical protein [Methylobacterium dankookense]|uniref:Uncharacterized protein n=1 Tax=Methylobacterium dankookense TaxID=560405 RepID=A0A564G0C9_9HYPH|nr:hypothetical protein [Methylobacterium dankookense]GJD57078.1 hypothetical protein IFDJLNFL_2978 [Methylobacterium dankookense]VUF13564.1 hypothetical protein MTDSW087_03271 [Methylobacterium dankookense]